MTLTVAPVDASRWDDLAALFGPGGAQRGCWCMSWRLTGRQFEANGKAGNRDAMHDLVSTGRTPGLLGYRDDVPIAWCSVGPRPDFERVLRSTTVGPQDPGDDGVWSVVCFFVRSGHRRSGVTDGMLQAAIDHARRGGARRLEGYPVDTEGGTRPGALYVGTIGLFQRAAFTLSPRPRRGRQVVMQLDLTSPAGADPSV